jgi:hypothetical protein
MPVDITNRKAAYFIRTAHEREADALEYQRRFLAGLAVQKRVTQGKRKLSLVQTQKLSKPGDRQRNEK